MHTAIPFSEMLSIFLRKIRIIIIFAIIGTILMTGFRIFSHFKGTASNPVTALNITLLNQQIEDLEAKIAEEQNYINGSIYMNLNPLDHYTGYYRFIFTAADSDNGQELSQDDLKLLRETYLAIWTDATLRDVFKDSVFVNTDEKYLREIILVSIVSNDRIYITSFANSSDAAYTLVTAAYNYISAQAHAILDSELQWIDTVSSYEVAATQSDSIANIQEKAKSTLSNNIATVDNLKVQLQELTSPAGMSLPISSILLFALIGFVAGLLIGCLVILCISYISPLIYASRDLSSISDLHFLGNLDTDNSGLKKLASRLTREKTWVSQDDATNYIMQRISMTFISEDKLNALVYCVDGEATKNTDAFQERLKTEEITYTIVDNFDSAESLNVLESCNTVILLESIGKSRLADAYETVTLVKSVGISNIGFILV